MVIRWCFKLVSEIDYATPMANMPVESILILRYCQLTQRWSKITGAMNFSQLELLTFSQLESWLFRRIFSEDDLALHIAESLEDKTFSDLEDYKFFEFYEYYPREIGFGWYYIDVRIQVRSGGNILLAIAPGCAQSDEVVFCI